MTDHIYAALMQTRPGDGSTSTAERWPTWHATAPWLYRATDTGREALG